MVAGSGLHRSRVLFVALLWGVGIMNYVITPDPFRRNTWWLSENAGSCKRLARIQVSEGDSEQVEINFWSPDIEYSDWFGSLKIDAIPPVSKVQSQPKWFDEEE